jgi:ubiquinone/menaquinone biosynthesis C-methylase UbiE
MPRSYRLLNLGIGLIVAACVAAQAGADEADRIAELMDLRPGMQVADVGAGDGEWSEVLARRVGESGHVYVTEIDEEELSVEDSDLGNVTVVTGEPDSTMLPDACCDAILLRLVYHHMTHHEEMRASLHRSLRSGGLLFVIEKEERYDHGVRAEDLIAEMAAAGFEVVSRQPEWYEDDLYGVLFRRSS